MCDIVFYVGNDIHDFSIISAAFKQLAHPVELHFVTSPEHLFARLNSPQPAPSLLFANLPPDPAPVLEFLQHLKAHPTGRWIPVILIGDANSQWQHHEVISAGGAALMKSPLQIDSLQRLFSAGGDLLFRVFDDAPALSVSSRL